MSTIETITSENDINSVSDLKSYFSSFPVNEEILEAYRQRDATKLGVLVLGTIVDMVWDDLNEVC